MGKPAYTGGGSQSISAGTQEWAEGGHKLEHLSLQDMWHLFYWSLQQNFNFFSF